MDKKDFDAICAEEISKLAKENESEKYLITILGLKLSMRIAKRLFEEE